MSEDRRSNIILEKLPKEVQRWAESLPWDKRRYLLSLCHLMCAATPEMQADFLDDYTADGLVAKMLQDRDTQQRVIEYLQEFHIDVNISEFLLRTYIRQFYLHSAQDVRRTPDMYLESALRLVLSTEERTNVFNYILGFELLKMLFQMSWLQQERLYQLQQNQEAFLTTYIKPIQHAHVINGIIRPKYKKEFFFEKRDHFVQKPAISVKKVVALVTATFSTDTVTRLGFSIIRHRKSLKFDYEYIFREEHQDSIFTEIE